MNIEILFNNSFLNLLLHLYLNIEKICRTRWRSLRDTFYRHWVRRHCPSGSGAKDTDDDETITQPWFTSLLFLGEHNIPKRLVSLIILILAIALFVIVPYSLLEHLTISIFRLSHLQIHRPLTILLMMILMLYQNTIAFTMSTKICLTVRFTIPKDWSLVNHVHHLQIHLLMC